MKLLQANWLEMWMSKHSMDIESRREKVCSQKIAHLRQNSNFKCRNTSLHDTDIKTNQSLPEKTSASEFGYQMSPLQCIRKRNDAYMTSGIANKGTGSVFLRIYVPLCIFLTSSR